MKKLPISLLLLLASTSAYAQCGSANTAPSGFFNRWEARASATQSKQPGWAVPLVTTTTGLIQVLRTDMVRPVSPAGVESWNIDNSKGLNLIPWARTELVVNLPPYMKHNTTAVDGFGDFSFLAKYRIASGNAQHGAYTLSAWVLTTVPTGTYKNGSTNASVAPSVGAGKGFGAFDVQTTLGATLPTGTPASTTAGRPVAWNTVAQYRVGKLFWPELESNMTIYKGGTNDGKTQEFITPGLLIGKMPIHPDLKGSRPGFTFGAGMQIATSQFHTFNHGVVATGRFIF
jgi:hypothetical protein